MANGGSVADLRSVLDAYATLEVENDASPDRIRAAYRALANHYHPDRLPPDADASDREVATRRMARVNSAYALIRDAPLRFHSFRNGPSGDWPEAETELERILQRARARRRWQQAGVVLAFIVCSVIALRRLAPTLVMLGVARPVAWLIVVALMGAAWMLRRSGGVWLAIRATVQLLRLFAR